MPILLGTQSVIEARPVGALLVRGKQVQTPDKAFVRWCRLWSVGEPRTVIYGKGANNVGGNSAKSASEIEWLSIFERNQGFLDNARQLTLKSATSTTDENTAVRIVRHVAAHRCETCLTGVAIGFWRGLIWPIARWIDLVTVRIEANNLAVETQSGFLLLNLSDGESPVLLPCQADKEWTVPAAVSLELLYQERCVAVGLQMSTVGQLSTGYQNTTREFA